MPLFFLKCGRVRTRGSSPGPVLWKYEINESGSERETEPQQTCPVRVLTVSDPNCTGPGPGPSPVQATTEPCGALAQAP